MFAKSMKQMALAALTCALVSMPALADGHEKADLSKGGTPATAETGSVKGVVKFNGKQAKRKPLNMAADPKCAAAHSDKPALSEKYVFGENDTLVNVLVYIEDANLKSAVPAKPHIINQVGCVYTPHVSAAVAGQEVHIVNGDNTMHNVNYKPPTTSKNKPFNVAQPVKGMVEKKKFTADTAAGSLTCQVHPWMNAYLWNMPHGYFAVTQNAGTFEITGLPPGEYTLKTWHAFKPFLPNQTSFKVKVEAGKAAELEVVYAPKPRN